MQKNHFFLWACLCLSIQFVARAQDILSFSEYSDLLYVEASKVENDSLQRLNLVIPDAVEKAPLFIWIGGGAWAYVDRHGEMDLARKFAEAGMAVASLGHRLSPAVWKDPRKTGGVRHPAHIRDVAAAFKWLYDHADTYGYDRDRMFIGGFSSGGHLAALLSVDEKYLSEFGLTPTDIKGVIPIAGAYDISAYHRAFQQGGRPELADLHVKAVFGDTEAHFEEASPTTYVTDLEVPMLLISERDTYEYTKIFEDKIRETGLDSFSVLHVRDMGHGEFWNHLAHADSSAFRDAIIDFVKS